jgi:hypothetical protein
MDLIGILVVALVAGPVTFAAFQWIVDFILLFGTFPLQIVSFSNCTDLEQLAAVSRPPRKPPDKEQ